MWSGSTTFYCYKKKIFPRESSKSYNNVGVKTNFLCRVSPSMVRGRYVVIWTSVCGLKRPDIENGGG